MVNKWLLKGKVLEIDKDELVFTEEEIKQLFDKKSLFCYLYQ